MKKVFLVITIALFSLNTFGQQKINIDNLIGYWKPNEESSQLFFWKDINGKLQVQEICQTSGEPIDLIKLEINEYSLIIDTIFKQNKWTVRSEYTSIELNKLICTISGSVDAIIYYTKIK